MSDLPVVRADKVIRTVHPDGRVDVTVYVDPLKVRKAMEQVEPVSPNQPF